MIETLILVEGEGRRLFVVEGAQAEMLSPAPGELDAAADDIGQWDAIA